MHIFIHFISVHQFYLKQLPDCQTNFPGNFLTNPDQKNHLNKRYFIVKKVT